MEFRVLGPLEVEDQGRTLSLEGRGERHLLAVLVCLANELVPVERLIDELWGDDPPATARNMIQQYVSRLRHEFGDDTRLTTERSGYRLRIAVGELDAAEFEDRVESAHTKPTAEAAGELRHALGLWIGPAYAGVVDGTTVRAERTRLEEARLLAFEERFACDLALGRHSALVPELEALVTQLPLRERLRGQMMTALYRCGRQAESLRSFTDYRTQLGEETGLEPGLALSELEGRILECDPTLDVDSPEPAPCNLPLRLSSFVGRADEIEEVTARLSAHRLVTLTGAGGVGKTSLAIRAASESLSAFPDGVWLVDLAPLTDELLVATTTAGVIGAPLAPRQDPTTAVTTALQGQVALLVLDNCEHLAAVAAAFASTVLQSSARVRVLATSREPLGVTGESLMRVPSLQVPGDSEDPATISAVESVILFADRARLLRPEFTVDDSTAPATAEICSRLDGIPLAIELAAARLGTMGIHEIASNVENRYHLLTKGARTAPHRHQTLRALVDWSHDLLTDEERTLLRRLGVFAGSFTLDAAKYVCGYDPLDEAIVEDALDQLVDASLVDPPAPGSDRFRMIETIREYAQGHLEASDETDMAMRLLARYLVEEGPESVDGYPVSDYLAWYEWRDAEQHNFRAVLDWSLTAHDCDIASTVTIEFRGFLVETHLHKEAASYLDETLGLLPATASHQRLLLLWMQAGDDVVAGDLAIAYERIRALHAEAQAIGERGPIGIALGYEAIAAVRQGNMAEADALFDEAANHLLPIHDERAMDVLPLHAFHVSRTGNYEKARALLDRTIAEARVAEQADKRFVECLRNTYGAWVEHHSGNLDKAESMLDAERDYVAQFGAGEKFVFYLVSLSLALARSDKPALEDSFLKMKSAVPATAPPPFIRDAATLSALYHLERKESDQAESCLRTSLRIASEYENLPDTAELVYVIGDAAHARNQHSGAVVLYAAATGWYERFGLVPPQWQQQRLDNALATLNESLGKARFDDLWAEGAAMSFDEMVDYARGFLGMDPV